MSEIKPVFEFLLWANCGNNCKFCFQKQQLRDGIITKHSTEDKVKTMNNVLSFLDGDDYIKGSHILLVGGEIFDDPTIFGELDSFLVKIADKMACNDIDLLYINTNLIYKKLDCVTNFLSEIEKRGLFDRLKFTTSYDIDGRFTEKTEKLMLSNLKELHTKFEGLHSVTNIILSDKMCDNILSGEFDFLRFEEEYKTEINFIPYIILIPELSATREKIFKTLMKINVTKPYYIEPYIIRLDLNQDKRLYNCYPDRMEYVSAPYNKCGHSVNFTRYSTKGSCYICDVMKMFLWK